MNHQAAPLRNILTTRSSAWALAALLLVGCTTVEVTRTTKEKFPRTKVAEVQILKTTPAQAYDEIGTVAVSGFKIKEASKMHQQLREKAAAVGADAVILTTENLDPKKDEYWATGAAIRFK